MDENNILRAIKTFTADNYNGTSMYLDNLAIPALRNNTFNIVIKTFDGSSCVLPCTDNEDMFVGEMKVGSTAEKQEPEVHFSISRGFLQPAECRRFTGQQ